AYAGTGLKDTTRIAQSSPAMWMPIFKYNRHNLLSALKEHQNTVQTMIQYLEEGNFKDLEGFFNTGARYRNILGNSTCHDPLKEP
ncbi:MAG TPA: prephenate dehydrogenase/arogenate dehydrogenase family protein, partial [Opitutales bacterium]|nr:prephenate dehydrogenase/arogenate dehydrogenase family protein [Opitutales bacterium]